MIFTTNDYEKCCSRALKNPIKSFNVKRTLQNSKFSNNKFENRIIQTSLKIKVFPFRR